MLVKTWFIVRVGVVGLSLVAAAACGGAAPASSSQPADQTESLAAAAPTEPPPAAPAPAPAAPAVAQPRLVKPVAFEQLLDLLPDLEGWNRRTPRGEETPLGDGSIARAEAVYERGQAEVELVITDSGFNPLVLAPLASSLAPAYSERSSDGYRRAEAIGGHPGFEEWHRDARRAEVTVVVANRFVVSAVSARLDSVDAARALVRAVDLSKLSALRAPRP